MAAALTRHVWTAVTLDAEGRPPVNLYTLSPSAEFAGAPVPASDLLANTGLLSEVVEKILAREGGPTSLHTLLDETVARCGLFDLARVVDEAGEQLFTARILASNVLPEKFHRMALGMLPIPAPQQKTPPSNVGAP